MLMLGQKVLFGKTNFKNVGKYKEKLHKRHMNLLIKCRNVMVVFAHVLMFPMLSYI